MNTFSIRRSPRTELACTVLAGFSLAARRRPTYLVWIVALILAAFTGCLKENPVEPQETASQPGIGSTFIYKVASGHKWGGRQTSFDTMRATRRGLHYRYH